jgi:hypothetical protein
MSIDRTGHVRARVCGRGLAADRAFVWPALAVLSGCMPRGAPSLSVFGAFFPAWMLCALIGVAAALAARAGIIVLKWNNALPYQLFVCTSIGATFGFMVWLIWFGR